METLIQCDSFTVTNGVTWVAYVPFFLDLLVSVKCGILLTELPQIAG